MMMMMMMVAPPVCRASACAVPEVYGIAFCRSHYARIKYPRFVSINKSSRLQHADVTPKKYGLKDGQTM